MHFVLINPLPLIYQTIKQKKMTNNNRNAAEIFYNAVMTNAKISRQEAERLLKIYKKLKVIKCRPYDIQPHVTHGAFYEKDVILKALKEY